MNKDLILSKAYYDPRTGFVGADKLYQRVKSKGITLAEVKAWLKNQYVAQVQKPVNSGTGIPFSARSPKHIVQADLMFYDKFGQQNSGYKYILNLIDVYSRKGFAYPLKVKSDAKKNIETFLKSHKIVVLQVDKGTEFVNSELVTLCERNNVELSVAKPEDKQRQAIVERFNKTIRQMLGKYMQANGTKKWVDVLPKFVANYNDSIHSTTDQVPDLAFAGKVTVATRVPSEATLKKLRSFNSGDKVRRLLNRSTFQKSGKPRWSDQIYTISMVLPFSFKLKASNGVVLEGTYRIWELQKVDKVENIPQPKKRPVTRSVYKEAAVEAPNLRPRKKKN